MLWYQLCPKSFIENQLVQQEGIAIKQVSRSRIGNDFGCDFIVAQQLMQIFQGLSFFGD